MAGLIKRSAYSVLLDFKQLTMVQHSLLQALTAALCLAESFRKNLNDPEIAVSEQLRKREASIPSK